MKRMLGKICLLVAGLTLGTPMLAIADPIKPGFDLLNVKKAAFERKDPSGANKVVPLKGVPFKKPTAADLGNTNKILQRKGGLGKNEAGKIPFKLKGLSLKSKKPFKVFGKTGLFNAFVSLNPNAGRTANKGKLNVKPHVDGKTEKKDGKFQIDTPFLLSLLIEFIPVDMGRQSAPFEEILETEVSSAGGSWSHSSEKGYPTIPSLPAGGFYFGDFGITNGVFRMQSIVQASTVTEPVTLALLGTGLMLIGFGRRRMRSV